MHRFSPKSFSTAYRKQMERIKVKKGKEKRRDGERWREMKGEGAVNQRS